MTTIAYRNGVIAADTGVTFGGDQIPGVRKIARNAAGDLAGSAGAGPLAQRFLCWFEAGEAGEQPSLGENAENGASAIVVRRATGLLTYFEWQGSYPIAAPYFAMGAGRPEALGAMFVGASAEDAVRAALAHDQHTSGDVSVLTCAD